VKSEIAEISSNPQSLILEALHSAGYSGALGNPLMASESAISRLNGTILEEFVTVSAIHISSSIYYIDFINKLRSLSNFLCAGCG